MTARETNHRTYIPLMTERESTDRTSFSFMSPSSINTQSLPPLMDPPTWSGKKTSPPPPPLTKRFLSLLTPEKGLTVISQTEDNDAMVDATQGNVRNRNKPDPTTTGTIARPTITTIPSPTDSVTQAMKTDLEDLIAYIDGLTLDNAKTTKHCPDRTMTAFGNDPTPRKPGDFQDHQSLRRSPLDNTNKSQAIFRDRTNQDVSLSVQYKGHKPDPLPTTTPVAEPGYLRLEPNGSPPSGEHSLYFHDESLSMILSQSSEHVGEASSTTEEPANIVTHCHSQSPLSKTDRKQPTSSPRFISTFRANGILPPGPPSNSDNHIPTERKGMIRGNKTTSFLPISKDPTPTKISIDSRSNATPGTVREDSFNMTRYCEVTPSKEYSSSSDEHGFLSRSLLQSRQGTPYPTHSLRDNSILEHDEMMEGGSSLVQNLNEVTNPSEMETPQPQTRSFPKLTSPENAKKILETAVETLKDARQEREIARQWAQDIKESVQQWVEQQRELIRSESASVAATSAASSAQVQQLESSINKLQSEIARSNSSRSNNEQKLEKLLLQQEDQIFAIAKELNALKDHLAIIDQRSSSKDRLRTFNLPKYPCPQEGNASPGLVARKSTPTSICRAKDVHNINSSLRWSETSMASSHASRTRRRTPNGGHVIDYGNGVTKEVHPDGTTVTRFSNGDVETQFSDLSTPKTRGSKGIVAYFHSREGVLQITQKDGSVLYEYSNGQMERHLQDGTKVVLFPDGSKTIVRGAKQSNQSSN
ncbi:T-complex protein 10 C-terminus domain containing protein [Nitzschia inconspicua]|uniref:T-complex protein 10 C-terminus domain containing protein n=1 Tax=Nitzschia inconspicua TaxID=303405 RepID=A0A9K3LG30_9STRA|nr:T-complex protein 10 C-terminus domain containing protein [Nitzschia inconspicua]